MKPAPFDYVRPDSLAEACELLAADEDARLIAGGFELLDTQYVTEHLRSFGALEIPRRRYTTLLDRAIKGEADFCKLPVHRPIGGAQALAIIAARG